MRIYWKKILSAAVAAGLAVAALAGCQGKGESDSAAGGQAMGRYVEEEVSLPEGIMTVLDMVKMEDGKLRLFGSDENGLYTLWDSGDNGASWEKAGELPADTFGDEGVWFSAAALSPSGEGFLCGYGEDTNMCYYHMTAQAEMSQIELDLGEMRMDESGAGEYVTSVDEVAEEESASAEGASEEEPESKEAEEPFVYQMELANSLMSVRYSPDGVLFGNDYNGKLYQINPETGELEKEITSDAESFEIAGDTVLVQSISAGLTLYHAGTGEPMEQDQLLADMLKDEGGMTSYVMGVKKFLFQSGDEENSVYCCSSKGLYRHILGGSVNEQLIDGNLDSLGSPDTGLIAMSALDDGSFLILISQSEGGNKLLKYTYSKDIPSRPSKELKLYALNDNAEIRQAISMFQKENADYYINFEVGLTGEDGATVSDALKTLNADIMAGKGPDVLVLDGMPIQSYIEKGLLADLTDVLLALKEGDGCFETIAGTYGTENGICAIVSRFGIPVIEGSQEILKEAGELSAFADAVEQLRAENPEIKAILESNSAEVLTEKLYEGYSPALMNGDGSLNQEKVKEFYTQLKRIYDTGNYTEEEKERVSYSVDSTGAASWKDAASGVMELLGGSIKINIGMLTDVMGFNQMIAGNKELDLGYDLLSLAGKRVYCPGTILGISSKSGQTEEAGKFVSYLLGKEAQSINQGSGFPVNLAAYEESTADNSGGEIVLGFMSSDSSTGEMVSLDVHWAEQEEFETLREKIDSLDTPGLTDSVMGDAIKEQAVKYLEGECTAEEAVSSLMQKVNLYLAE